MLRKAFKYLLFIYCKKTSTLTTQAYFQKKKKTIIHLSKIQQLMRYILILYPLIKVILNYKRKRGFK